MAKKITLIEPTAQMPDSPESFSRKKEKVAAYARVSTDHEEQASSLAAQTDYYKKKILANPGWEFAGIYADDGVSGTSFHRREEFNRMMQDCRDGKITMILTKSISRFARNTVDSIKFIRELKALGIGVMFEKENIWTLDSKGEFLLTVMSSIAQEESRSISENVSWGHRKRMADGKYSVAFSRFLGYDQGKDGEFVINEQEAVYVRRIFSLYIQGYSGFTIAEIADEEGIPTPSGNGKWHASTIDNIVSNEKYKGDALLQKTFTKDFLTKEQKKNEGELPQYYVKGGHPAIVEPALFDYVQELVKQRAEVTGHYSGQNPLSCKMICGICGNYFGVRPWHIVDDVWQCRERGKTGHTCANTHIYDYALWYQLKQLLMTFIGKRTVMVDCRGLIKKHVKDKKRRDKALDFLDRFLKADPDTIEFGEEPAYVIQMITIFPNNRMKAKFIDGSKMSFKLKRYTPKLGWRKEEKKTVSSEELLKMLDERNTETNDEDTKPPPAPELLRKHALTEEDKIMIGSLLRKGAGYKKISKQLSLNVNTVKSYCRRHADEIKASGLAAVTGPSGIVFCKNCGIEVKQNPKRKVEIFCSDECRMKWWNTHQEDINRRSTAIYKFNCQCCGKEFAAYGHRGRKYCSHECYVEARYGSAKKNGTKADTP